MIPCCIYCIELAISSLPGKISIIHRVFDYFTQKYYFADNFTSAIFTAVWLKRIN